MGNSYAFVATAGILVMVAGCLQAPSAPDDDLATTADHVEQYAEERFADLNRQTGSKLTPFVRRISEIVDVREFIRKRDEYRAFLLAAMAQAAEGEDAEGIFLDELLTLTPPRLVADVVVPEIEAGGRLEGFFEPGGKGGTVRRHIERHVPKRVVSVGRPKPSPDFSLYAEYLRAETRDQHPALVTHIFRTDPRAALHMVMVVTDTLREGVNLQALAHDEHLVHDMLWHHQNGFEIEPQRLNNARIALQTLATHDQWWVRLYVAEILRRYPDVGTPQLVERLKRDENDLVRQAILADDSEEQDHPTGGATEKHPSPGGR